jgi:hypothetical protein
VHRPTRQPRAIAIAQPLADTRLMRDLARDWQRWTSAERLGAMLITALAAAAFLSQLILAAG